MWIKREPDTGRNVLINLDGVERISIETNPYRIEFQFPSRTESIAFTSLEAAQVELNEIKAMIEGPTVYTIIG